MKPANFPARKQARQQRALERLTRYVGATKPDKRTTEEMAVLVYATGRANVRSVRTKKDRRHDARLIRAA